MLFAWAAIIAMIAAFFIVRRVIGSAPSLAAAPATATIHSPTVVAVLVTTQHRHRDAALRASSPSPVRTGAAVADRFATRTI